MDNWMPLLIFIVLMTNAVIIFVSILRKVEFKVKTNPSKRRRGYVMEKLKGFFLRFSRSFTMLVLYWLVVATVLWGSEKLGLLSVVVALLVSARSMVLLKQIERQNKYNETKLSLMESFIATFAKDSIEGIKTLAEHAPTALKTSEEVRDALKGLREEFELRLGTQLTEFQRVIDKLQGDWKKTEIDLVDRGLRLEADRKTLQTKERELQELQKRLEEERKYLGKLKTEMLGDQGIRFEMVEMD